MSFWKKIKSSFGRVIVAIPGKTSAFSHLFKLRREHHTIRKNMERYLNRFGSKVYQFHVEHRETQLFEETRDLIANLKIFEEQLRNKNQEIKDFMDRAVDRDHRNKFRKDLELADGKIEIKTL